MKKRLLSLAVVAALGIGFSGCGSDSDSNDNTGSTNVEVERGKVYDANVTDSSIPAQIATKKFDSNIYTFSTAPKYPITVSGGWIDIDGDGNKTTADITLDINMTSYSNVVTPLTTYLSDSNETIREQKLSQLMTDMNVSKEELLKVPSKANSTSILLSNAIYQKVKESNSSDMVSVSFDDLNTTFHQLEVTYHQSFDTNLTSEALAIAIEGQVVNTNLTGFVKKVTASDVSAYQELVKEKLEAEKQKTTNNSTSIPADLTDITIYRNTDTDMNTLKQSWIATNKAIYAIYNWGDLPSGVSCTSLGYTLKYENTTGYYVVKTYENSAGNNCFENDYSQTPGSSGTNNYIEYYKY